MSKVIHHEELTRTLALTECSDGFWLYDKTRGMNLSMHSKTRESAFIEAIIYYQDRLKEVETGYQALRGQVDSFVSQFINSEE